MATCGCAGLALPSHEPILLQQHEYSAYDAQEAAEFVKKFADAPADLALRCYTSNLIGSCASLVLHGGGNTSVKMRISTPVGEKMDVLCVKGSGYNLDSIVPKGFPQVGLVHLLKMLDLESLSDAQMVNEFKTHMSDASSPTPSVETLLHALIPEKFVDHSHADAIVALADHDIDEATTLFTKAFQGNFKFAIVPYIMPGFSLAGAARTVLEKAGQVDCLILLKHGLFTWGATAEESYNRHIEAVKLAEAFITSQKEQSLNLRPHVEPTDAFFDKVTCTLRGLFSELSEDASNWIVAYRDDPALSAFAQSDECEKLSQIGTITPDHVIRTKAYPLVIRGLTQEKFYKEESIGGVEETPKGDSDLRQHLKSKLEEYVKNYTKNFEANNERVGGTKTMLEPLPRVLLVEHFGVFTVAKDPKACHIAADIYAHTVPTMLSSIGASESKTYEPVTKEELFDVEYWSLEQAKLKLGGTKNGSLAGKVALITGGGSGIGLATAKLFAMEGACVFILDMIESRVRDGVQEIVKSCKNKFAAAGAIADVMNPEEVEAAFHECCLVFGGVDIVLSNAGVVVQAAPGIASVQHDQLALSMNVNFFGHHFIASAAIRRIVVQGSGGSLLFNVSKAPLNPGPRLGPYAIAKAAALALMRQIAVEYGDRQIRSNAVNADRVRTNLFDMSLVEKRAQARGLTADDYFRSNLLRKEVFAADVAKAFLSLATSEKTTASIYTVDGGNIAAAPR